MKERKADQDCYDFTLVQRVVLLKPPPQGAVVHFFTGYFIIRQIYIIYIKTKPQSGTI